MYIYLHKIHLVKIQTFIYVSDVKEQEEGRKMETRYSKRIQCKRRKTNVLKKMTSCV